MTQKKAAFHALKKMREQSPFPDIDFDEARRDATEAKYGKDFSAAKTKKRLADGIFIYS